ncbi:Transcription factor bHLH54 [Bienertia sinuspersici]
MGAFLDGDWESLCKLFTVDESPHLSSNLLEYSSPTSEEDDNLKFPLLSHVNENSYSSINDWISNPTQSFLQTKTTDHTTNSTDNSAADNFFSGDFLSCIDFSMVNGENDGFITPPINNIFHKNHTHNHNSGNNDSNNSFNSINKPSPNTELCLKRKRDVPVIQECSLETPKKYARISKDTMKKKRKANQKSDEDITATVNTKDSNETADSNSNDSDHSASEEITETEDSNSNMTLTLVPNGTKVDISTMLEEAFHYVKFLQLQIRLLSSDDLWMYAPLAYNGFDVGAYRKMPPFLGL